VLLPPPKCVRRPKVTTRSLFVLYNAASFSERSALDTFGREGWRTSTTNWRRAKRRFVMNLRVRKVIGAELSAYEHKSNQWKIRLCGFLDRGLIGLQNNFATEVQRDVTWLLHCDTHHTKILSGTVCGRWLSNSKYMILRYTPCSWVRRRRCRKSCKLIGLQVASKHCTVPRHLPNNNIIAYVII